VLRLARGDLREAGLERVDDPAECAEVCAQDESSIFAASSTIAAGSRTCRSDS
jgi:hypothetical protein